MANPSCELCQAPGRFDLRVTTLEDNYHELHASLKDYKMLVFQKFDSQNKYIIATLTTGLISALLLIINLIIIYGGR